MPGALISYLQHRGHSLWDGRIINAPNSKQMRCHSPNRNKALPFQPWQQCSERCLWCVALKTHIQPCIIDPMTARAFLTSRVSTLAAYEASPSLWNLTRPPCLPLAWARVRNAPLPLRHWLRCQQTATLSVSDSYSAAKWQKHGSGVRIYSVVKIHCWRAFLSPTVVSLYSELPPSMMISPASRRGTWGMWHGTDQVRQGSAHKSGFSGVVENTQPTSLSMKSSTACPALTSRMILLGFFSLDTMSSRDSAPITLEPFASFCRKSWTFDTVRL